MVVVVAKLKMQPGTEGDAEKQLKMLVEYVRNEEPGTLTYLCYRRTDDPTQFLMYERYIDQEAFNKHSSSARFLQIFGAVTMMMAGPPEVEMYEEVAGKRS